MRTAKVLGFAAFFGLIGGRSALAWDCGLDAGAKAKVRKYCACNQIKDDCDKLVTLRNKIRNDCNGVSGQVWRYKAITSAGTAMVSAVTKKVQECLSYEKRGQWLSAYNALSAARAAWKPNSTDFTEQKQQTGTGQTGDGTYVRTGNAAKDLANMKALCNAYNVTLGALGLRAAGMNLGADHREAFDGAVANAKANIKKCLSNRVAALTDFVNNAMNSVTEAKNVLDHWKGKKDAEAATTAFIKGLIAGNNALRNSLATMWSNIADLQDRGKKCLDSVNMYRENVATVCPNPKQQDVNSLTAQQRCLLGEIKEAGQVSDTLRRQIADDWSCKAYAGVDWAVGKFCGEFPAICQVVRDGRTCMQRIAGLGQAEIDAVKRVWAAVPGVGQIVLHGWSLDAVTALGKAALTGASQIVRAAGSAIAECGKWAARSAGTLVVATVSWVGEKLCSIDPGPMVCPLIRAAADCFSAAKSANLPSKVWAGLEKWRGGVSAITQEIVRGFKSADVKAAIDQCQAAIKGAGTKIKAVIEERKKWALEGWQAIKSFDCGKLVETFSKFDPLQQAMNATLPEFVAECGVQFKKGFICEIPDLLKGAWNLVSNAATTAWDNKLLCGGVAIATASPGSALACGLGIYIGKQVPKMISGAKKIWQCLSSLKAKGWFNLIKGAACHFAGALALEAALGALSHGATVPAFIAKLAHYAHSLLHVAHLGGGKPAHAVIAMAHEIGHMCGGHGGEGEHGGGETGHGTSTGGDHGTTPAGGHGTTTTGGGHGTTTGGTGHPTTTGGQTGQTSSGKAGYVNGSGVNLRKSPSTNAAILKVGDKCEPITILEQGIKGPGAAAWTKVLYKGLEGYMASSYVAECACSK